MTGAIRLPNPHKGQQIVLSQAKRFNWLSAGRRWRKTTMGMSIAVELAAKGRRGFWGAPTYDQVRIGVDEAKYACGGAVDFKLSTMTATFPSGGEIIYRSMDDPDNARGHSFDFAILDEVADVKPEGYYDVISPILANYEYSLFWGLGTPKGRNYFYKEFHNALTDDESMAWQVPTKGCYIKDGQLIRDPHTLENPDFPWDEVVRLFNSMPTRTFQQEILAQFLEGEGAVFRNINACLGAPLKPDMAQHAGHQIMAGVDWAKSEDYTAISIGCRDCRVEIARDRFNKVDYALQTQRLRGVCEKYGVQRILVELNSIGEPNFESLQRMGLPVIGFQTTATSKPPLIENLALALERGEWQFQDDPIWTGELEAYEMKVNPVTNRTTYNAPSGMHDDTVMARALMLKAAEEKRYFLSDY